MSIYWTVGSTKSREQSCMRVNTKLKQNAQTTSESYAFMLVIDRVGRYIESTNRGISRLNILMFFKLESKSLDATDNKKYKPIVVPCNHNGSDDFPLNKLEAK